MACFGMCGGDSPVDDSIIVLIDAAVPVGLEVDNLGKGKKAIVVDNVKPNTACAKAGIARNMVVTKINEEVLEPGLDIAAFGDKARGRDIGTASCFIDLHLCGRANRLKRSKPEVASSR